MADPTPLILSEYGDNASGGWQADSAVLTHSYDPNARPNVEMYVFGGSGIQNPSGGPPVYSQGGNATASVSSNPVTSSENGDLALWATGGDGSEGGDATVTIHDLDLTLPWLTLHGSAQGGDAQPGGTDGDATITVRDTNVRIQGYGAYFAGGFVVSSFSDSGATDGVSKIDLIDNNWYGDDQINLFGLLFTTNEADSAIDDPATVTFQGNVIDLGGGTDVLTIQELRGTSLYFDPSTNRIDGGDGYDVLGFESDTGVTIDLPRDGFVNFEFVMGSMADDTFIDGDASTTFMPGSGTNEVDGRYGNDTFMLSFGIDDYDGGEGIDTVDLSQSTVPAKITLWALEAIGDGIAHLWSIERAVGSAFDDEIYGDSGWNDLIGGDGNDLIDGMGGVNLLEGGQGDDKIEGWVGDDTVVYGRGTEFVEDVLTDGVRVFLFIEILPQDTVNFGWDALIAIENAWGTNAQDTLVGSAVNNELVGWAANDVLAGLAGNDELLGGDGDDLLDGGEGLDEMYGGAGDDTYYVDASGDQTFDNAFGGYDRVISTASFALRSHEEELYLTGDLALNARGNNIANVILGNAANNHIDGLGGDDLLFGGEGDDTYYADSPLDVVFEGASAGTDHVIARSGYYMFANIENLTLAETDIPFGIGDLLNQLFGSIVNFNVDFFGVGNELDNVIRGNSGENLLLGGAGHDEVFGGGDNDTIFGEDGNDRVHGDDGVDFVAGGAGNDHVSGGLDADALYGEDGDDELVSGEGNFTDILIGGAGNDVLYAISGQADPDYDLLDGGDGDDTYWVDTAADLTFETDTGGIDTVHANVPVDNAGVYLWANVENLVLEGTTAYGVGNDLGNRMTGNAEGNWLLGGAGADTLDGKGGGDVLFGEAGADIFVFEKGGGGDVIGDFQVGADRINLIGYSLDFAALQTRFVQNGNVGAIVLNGGDLIVLHNVQMNTLTAADFVFG